MAEGLAEKGTTFNCRECKYGSECNTANAHGYKVGFCSQYTQKTKAKTNADRIRCMTNEELAAVITGDWCEIVCSGHLCDDGSCKQHVLKWLKEEVKDV